MMIKMLLEEASQYFYCEARKTSPHSFEGIVHFLHKVGEGNAFVRAKAYTVNTSFASRQEALMAAERYGRNIAPKLVENSVNTPQEHCAFNNSAQVPGRQKSAYQEKPVC